MSVSLRGWCVGLVGCLLMFAPLGAEDAVVPDEPPKTLAYRNTMLALLQNAMRGNVHQGHCRSASRSNV